MPTGGLRQKAQSSRVPFCQVHDMDVISDTSAVCGGVIVSKHTQFRTLAGSDLGDVGHEVVGHTIGVFAD
jgi:hypothetical protein